MVGSLIALAISNFQNAVLEGKKEEELKHTLSEKLRSIYELLEVATVEDLLDAVLALSDAHARFREDVLSPFPDREFYARLGEMRVGHIKRTGTDGATGRVENLPVEYARAVQREHDAFRARVAEHFREHCDWLEQ